MMNVYTNPEVTERDASVECEYRVELIADSTGKWAGNGMRYETAELAERAAIDTARAWTSVREWRVRRKYTDDVHGAVDVEIARG